MTRPRLNIAADGHISVQALPVDALKQRRGNAVVRSGKAGRIESSSKGRFIRRMRTESSVVETRHEEG